MRKIVLLDRISLGDDIDISIFEAFGRTQIYSFTDRKDIRNRICDADIVITNKCMMNRDTLEGTPVRLICLTATGTDNVDLNYCREAGIAVCNVKGYSTESVVQHTFALLLSLTNQMDPLIRHVRDGSYINDTSYTHLGHVFHEICGKTMGIIGLGTIGTRVAQVASCLGCNVVYWSSTDTDRSDIIPRLNFLDLITQSDIVSIHSPLTEKTRDLFHKGIFEKMKPGAMLINLARGGIIVEEDLVSALENRLIAGAALDVLRLEPMSPDCPYRRILNYPNFILTPHVGWAAFEARTRCMKEIVLNIEAFFQNQIRNRVDITG